MKLTSRSANASLMPSCLSECANFVSEPMSAEVVNVLTS